jgi:hypothetical protein
MPNKSHRLVNKKLKVIDDDIPHKTIMTFQLDEINHASRDLKNAEHHQLVLDKDVFKVTSSQDIGSSEISGIMKDLMQSEFNEKTNHLQLLVDSGKTRAFIKLFRKYRDEQCSQAGKPSSIILESQQSESDPPTMKKLVELMAGRLNK